MHTIFREHKTTDSNILEIWENTTEIILHNNPDDFVYEADLRKQVCRL